MWGFSGRIGGTQQGLLALSLVLALALWVMIASRQQEETTSGPAGTPQQVEPISKPLADLTGKLQRATPPPLDTFATLDDRPLFSMARRPGASDQGLTGQTQGVQVGDYLLQGIVIGNEQRLALLINPKTNATLRVAEGESVGNWTAKEIGKDFVRFEAAGVERLLQLTKSSNDRDN